MDDMKVESITLEDGRRAERRISEKVDPETCVGEKVVEQWEEDPRPLNLKKRVREEIGACVRSRITELIDGDEVVDRQVESIDPNPKLHLTEHIGLAHPSVQAQSSSDCVSREELKTHLDSVVEGFREAMANKVSDDDEYEWDYEEESTVAPLAHQNVRAQQVVAEDVEKSKSWGFVEIALVALIGVELAYFAIKILPQYMS